MHFKKMCLSVFFVFGIVQNFEASDNQHSISEKRSSYSLTTKLTKGLLFLAVLTGACDGAKTSQLPWYWGPINTEWERTHENARAVPHEMRKCVYDCKNPYSVRCYNGCANQYFSEEEGTTNPSKEHRANLKAQYTDCVGRALETQESFRVISCAQSIADHPVLMGTIAGYGKGFWKIRQKAYEDGKQDCGHAGCSNSPERFEEQKCNRYGCIKPKKEWPQLHVTKWQGPICPNFVKK